MTAHAPPTVPTSDTIVALASGFGRSDRALVRLSGPQVGEVLARLCPGVSKTVGVHAGRLLFSGQPGGLELPCLMLLALAPRSYTGEDTAELLIPGNPLLIERVIGRVRAVPGVREAEPGEFSARAYLNGRLSLDQAEGVAALIGARTEDQLAAAKSLLTGRTGDRYRAWADEVATLLALVEGGIDFTDQEDVVPIGPEALADRLRTVQAEIESTLGAGAGTERSSGLPRIVLAGRPNSGKSTLFNALLGRHRAMTSPVAGTTRDAIAEELDLSREVPCGPIVTLVDLAGLDAGLGGRDTIDHAAQQQADREIGHADAILLCDPEGRFDVRLAGATNRPIVRIRTKGDLPGTHSSDAIGVCALDGWNLGVLRRAIADAAASAGSPAGGMWLMPRHRRTLGAGAAALGRARDVAGADGSRRALRAPEVIAGHLREAVAHLGELVGRISPDDIIGRIFATFCVGK